jgi:hypothetical protein
MLLCSPGVAVSLCVIGHMVLFGVAESPWAMISVDLNEPAFLSICALCVRH